MNKPQITALLLANLLYSSILHSQDLSTATYNSLVDKSGAIRLPENFRQNWAHLGSWVVTDPKAPGHGFHDVYTQPEAVKAFLELGKFPDGTVLIKEIRKLDKAKLTTGEAVWAGDNAVWFVMIKDNLGRFKGNPNWTEGWGWGLFEYGDNKVWPTVNVSKGFESSCKTCHLPAKATDWVFVQGYPTFKPK